MYFSHFVFVLVLAITQFSVAATVEDPDPVEISNKNENQHGKIVGGSSTRIEDVPYQVSLMFQMSFGKSQCGGSLISARYVITAAHCIMGASAAYVRVGSSSANTGGMLIYTNTFHIHPEYDVDSSDYDVAILDMNRNINLDGLTSRAIPLPSEETDLPLHTELFVSGWGTTTEGGRVSDTLKGVSVPIVSHTECQRAYSLAMITDRMICAGMPTGGLDSCQGDSGGPAAIGRGEVLVGIVSFGNGCARPNTPGVYTNISAVRGWIREITGF